MPLVTEAETLERALNLSDSSRAKLAEKLIASLPSPFVAEDADWVEEALQRDREMDENPDSVMTHEEFFTSLREHIR
ncbi:MAG: addiction module protein [Pyrinomonadaceae bacterium]